VAANEVPDLERYELMYTISGSDQVSIYADGNSMGPGYAYRQYWWHGAITNNFAGYGLVPAAMMPGKLAVWGQPADKWSLYGEGFSIWPYDNLARTGWVYYLLPLDEVEMEPGEKGYFHIDYLFSYLGRCIRGSAQHVYGNISWKCSVSLYDPKLQVVENYITFTRSMGDPSVYPNSFYDDFSDLWFAFEYPDGDGYAIIATFEFGIKTNTAVSNSLVAKEASFAGFHEMHIYREIPPDPEEEWKDEQRGFWAKVIDFLESIANFFENIGDWIVGLFVPSEEDLEKELDEFLKYVDSHLGVVVQIPQIFSRLMSAIQMPGESEDVVFVLPKAQLPEAFSGETLWEGAELNVTKLIKDIPVLKTMYGFYQVLASVLLFGMLLRFVYRFAETVLDEKSTPEDSSDKEGG